MERRIAMESSDRFQLVNTALEEALDLPSAERAAFAKRECGADESLLRELLDLLALSESQDGILESSLDSSTEIRLGDVLGGRFRILQELGSGGLGSIFLADDCHLGLVALKTIHNRMRGPTCNLQRIAAEVRAARALRHRNLCPVFDLFTFDHERCGPITAFTMEYLPGETLMSRLSRGPIPPSEATEIARDIANGLDSMHAEGVVHCDLKPANIMLTPTPVIMDFGLATSLAQNSLHGAAFGSPDYMAPEQFRRAAITKSVDLYAFGLIVFEMVAGVRPFPSEDLLATAIRRSADVPPCLRSVAPWAPASMDAAITHSLSAEPLRRPQSAGEIVAVMERGRTLDTTPLARLCGHDTRPPSMRSARITRRIRFHRPR
jgi:eukaryotic-like serine/threonine-protein kinase